MSVKEERGVKVSMSDRDYAALLQAVEWIVAHAGVDAPPYPNVDRLTEVVNNIARRREVSEQTAVADR